MNKWTPYIDSQHGEIDVNKGPIINYVKSGNSYKTIAVFNFRFKYNYCSL